MAGTAHKGVTGQVYKIADANKDQLQCPAAKFHSPPGARARGGLGRPHRKGATAVEAPLRELW